MSTETELALASPLDRLAAEIASALGEEDDRFAAVVDQARLEHEETKGRLQAALDLLAGTTSNGQHVSQSNGNVPTAPTASAAPAPPNVPVIAATDTVIDPASATVRDFIRAVMRTRIGQVWRAEEVLERMKALGYSGGANDTSRLGTVRATLGQMVKARELQRPVPGDFILPMRPGQ